MSNIPNPNATSHLPMFIAGPGQTDVCLIIGVFSLITVLLLVGVFYFSLHALPERMAHGADKMKLQFVGIRSLVARFTHNNYFWIAALLIAALELPDFLSPIKSLARSVKAQTILLKARAAESAPSAPTQTTTSEK